MVKVKGITFTPEKCTGCRACEVACSYHHKGVFGRSLSSITIHRNLDVGKMDLTLYRRKIGDHLPCNNCVDEKEPHCIKYCDAGAITLMG